MFCGLYTFSKNEQNFENKWLMDSLKVKIGYDLVCGGRCLFNSNTGPTIIKKPTEQGLRVNTCLVGALGFKFTGRKFQGSSKIYLHI